MLNSRNPHYHWTEMLFVLTLPPAANCTGQNSGEISQVISKTRLSADKLVDWSPNLIHFYTSTKWKLWQEWSTGSFNQKKHSKLGSKSVLPQQSNNISDRMWKQKIIASYFFLSQHAASVAFKRRFHLKKTIITPKEETRERCHVSFGLPSPICHFHKLRRTNNLIKAFPQNWSLFTSKSEALL